MSLIQEQAQFLKENLDLNLEIQYEKSEADAAPLF